MGGFRIRLLSFRSRSHRPCVIEQSGFSLVLVRSLPASLSLLPSSSRFLLRFFLFSINARVAHSEIVNWQREGRPKLPV